MSTNVPQVQNTTTIYPVTLIDLDLNGNVYYLSDAYKPYTVGSNSYTELGAFLSIANLDDNLKPTNGDITLSLSGIPSSSTGSEVNYLRIILEQPIKGGNITISRGFINTNTMELDTGSIYTRYKGIITNYSINEQVNFLNKQNDYSVSVTVASLITVLQNRIVGQRTDPTNRKRLYPADKSFDRIPSIANSPFDFGKEYNGYNGGRGGGGGGGCLDEFTLITMADGTLKQIRDIGFNDKILSYNHDKGLTEADTVLAVNNPLSNHLVHVDFGTKLLKLTQDHPIYVPGKGYCSHNPAKTLEFYGFDVGQYEIGDTVTTYIAGELDNLRIENIEVIEYTDTKTYNLKHIDKNNNYFANGVLVHNKYDNTPGRNFNER